MGRAQCFHSLQLSPIFTFQKPYLMKLNTLLTAGLLALIGHTTAPAQSLQFDRRDGDLTIVRIDRPTRYLLIPIQESAAEGYLRLAYGADMDVRLAVDSTDYFVPVALPQGVDKAEVIIQGVPAAARCWKEMKLSDTFDTTNRDYYRPIYHHTPAYGWMNDANGLVYQNGTYHLAYQYNPYAAVWGNMHWGHSTSTDLIHWKHEAPIIDRDAMGHIFSGSCVVDADNTAGYGKDAIVAFYTSHHWTHTGEQVQWQASAYSTDGGNTYTKISENPILKPADGRRDFRDPKVFWYAPEKKWVMIVSADKEMRFFESRNLRDWTYLSAFGEGYGRQPNQFECPEMVQLPVDGNKDNMKWVLIVNINPGCLFGGSATEYFVGNFDGRRFICDTAPEVTKWMDYGKDHYATVCFSNTGERNIAVPWMSNWQYANLTPTRQFRGQNALPRELKLFTGNDGQLYVASQPVNETLSLRKGEQKLGSLKPEQTRRFNAVEGAYEITARFDPADAETTGLILANDRGEQVNIYLDCKNGRLVMDRTQSGITDFGHRSSVHEREYVEDPHTHKEISGTTRKAFAVNYQNDFALGTWAPLNLCAGKTYQVDIFVDKSSVEIFVDGGRIAMTNLVFPTKPYDRLRAYSTGKGKVDNVKVYTLGL